jgi:hypothetical protein
VNQAERVIESIRAAGGTLAINGQRIRCRLPESATHLLEELRRCRNDVETTLRRRETTPSMPLASSCRNGGSKNRQWRSRLTL